jgi:hypothetical protein
MVTVSPPLSDASKSASSKSASSSLSSSLSWWNWTGKREFLEAQGKVVLILLVARIGDQWEPAYPRNENHSMNMFWASHVVLLLAAAFTWTHTPPRDPASSRITLLSRPQTEEWKGWMQFAFIMYHYYRAWSAYNWIRVFVSSYVWMTGFGNFLYFDKKKDFTIERIVSMVIRINYFPVLLSWVTGVSLDLYYVVPLHTEGFFMTLITCRLALYLEERKRMSYHKSRIVAILISLLVHVLFFETPAVNSLLIFSKEIHFRFQADKYSAWMGILFGYVWTHLSTYMTWAHGGSTADNTTTSIVARPAVSVCQTLGGIGLIIFWYKQFGYMTEKTEYNAIHPYVFIIPLTGWLMIRNSCRYMTEYHSSFLEFLGRNTLETYVLQFHLFMNHQVQFIPMVFPGSGPEGYWFMNVCNMLLCGVIFVSFAVWARKVTVSTQTTVVELTSILKRKYVFGNRSEVEGADLEEAKPMVN